MSKYYGLNYKSKARTSGTIDQTAIAKSFDDDNPERNALLRIMVDRINMLMPIVENLQSLEAHDIVYTDSNGNRQSLGDVIDETNGSETLPRWRLMYGA